MSNDDDVHVLRMRIIRLESQVSHIVKHLGIPMPEETEAAEDAPVLALLREGKMTEAVRRYREIHNVGLAESQRSVQDLQKQLGL